METRLVSLERVFNHLQLSGCPCSYPNRKSHRIRDHETLAPGLWTSPKPFTQAACLCQQGIGPEHPLPKAQVCSTKDCAGSPQNIVQVQFLLACLVHSRLSTTKQRDTHPARKQQLIGMSRIYAKWSRKLPLIKSARSMEQSCKGRNFSTARGKIEPFQFRIEAPVHTSLFRCISDTWKHKLCNRFTASSNDL